MSKPFQYTNQACQALEKAISPSRLAKYLSKFDNNRESALKLYHWNSELSQAMTFPLHMLEVCIRNAVSEGIHICFGDQWYSDSGFKVILDDYWEAKLEEAVSKKTQKAVDRSKRLSSGDIISELTFGFWRELLKAEYEKHIWKKLGPSGCAVLLEVFPDLPVGKRRQDIYNNVDRLVKLRNRISHHEPIYERFLQNNYNEAAETIGWISPDTKKWIGCHSNFLDVWSRKSQVIPRRPVEKPKLKQR